MLTAGITLYLGSRSSSPSAQTGRRAPAFTLGSTAGPEVSLADYRGSDVLLYFNEGVGCDACFYQMVELERHAGELEDAGLTVVPIAANPVEQVAGELERFGLRTPWLIDGSTRVSRAYRVLGTGMHANLPGHSFVLVDANGNLVWQEEYPSMYVSIGDLLSAIRAHL